VNGRSRVALIGAGGVAALHIGALARLDRADIVAVVDSDQDRALAAARRTGATCAGSVEAMLQDARPDAVWVCLPPFASAEACLAVARHGLPFFTEKPLSAVPGIPEMVAAEVADRGLVTAVGYQWRALDFLDEVRARLDDRPPHLVVARWLCATPRAPWWRISALSGGQVVEQATHQFDLARHLLGEAAVIAAAAARHPRFDLADADVDDVSAALLRYESGAIGSFAASCLPASARVQIEFVSEGLVTTITNAGDWPALRWAVAFDQERAVSTRYAHRDAYELEDERFLDAVVARDATAVFCTYADALATDQLTREVVTAAAVDSGRG
jgi:predicted dehydrogenase